MDGIQGDDTRGVQDGMIANAFFFHTINNIGGVETFFHELCKKYASKYEIVVYYVKADKEQLQRLRRYIKVIKYTGQEIYCKHAFFNYNLDPFLSHVHAEHTYEIIHANFDYQRGITPHIDDRIDTYVAVSRSNAEAYERRTGIKPEVCANPLTAEPIEYAPLFLCSAQRMTSEKGYKRMLALSESLDKTDIKYYWLIFTNQTKPMPSKNVVFMPYRLDIRPFIAGSDIFVALSDSEGRCYSVGEKLSYGHGKMLITPVPSFYEQGCDDTNSITLEFDLSNMDEVIGRIREIRQPLRADFKPVEQEDEWDEYLVHEPPSYAYEDHIPVRATKIYRQFGIYDSELGCVPAPGTEFVVDQDRLEVLINFRRGALVEVIDGRTQETL